LILNQGLPDRWRAGMAWCAAPRDNEGARCFLRRSFTLESVPESVRVFVTADSRYRLYVNGAPVGRGPLKGTLIHYFCEEYEIAPLLRAGRNVLAADVIWFGHQMPLSEEHSGFAGFLLQGPEELGIDTPGEWKAYADTSTTWDRTPYTSNAHIFLAGMEAVDGARFPIGWQARDFDDSEWPAAVFAAPINAPGGDADAGLIWSLRPREIPALVEEPRRFVRTLENMAPAPEHRFGETPTGWSLAPGQSGEIVLDAGELTTAYPVLEFAGGQGRTVEIVYGECLLQRNPEKPDDGQPYRWGGGGRLLKGGRDDLAGGAAVVHGYQDTVTLPGGDFTYEPHHWRTFWFLKIVVGPGDAEFRLRDASFRFTTYPQECRASFDAPAEPDLPRIWEVCWRTLQLCSHETYEDCPGYEQLNYLLDARNEALLSLTMAGETDLPRRTIRLFRDTLRTDGMLSSRTPSQKRQTIPIFALWWVRMLLDYWDWVGERDRDFVCACLYAVDGVLGYFRARLRPDGFVGELPYWNPIGGEGAPGTDLDPAIKAGGSTYVTALYLTALNDALRLHREAGGNAEDASRWEATRRRLATAVRSAFSRERGVFVERLSHPAEPVSQHTQAAAILSGAATRPQVKQVVKALEAGVPVARMTRQQGLPFAEAMRAAGRYDLVLAQHLPEYRRQLDLHLTTCLEGGERGRSDCHAWSAWLPAELLRSVLGVRPALPGFAAIEIAPAVVLPEASGVVPTPAGEVRVSWRQDGRSVLLEADAPEGVPVHVRLPDGTSHTFARGGRGLKAEGLLR
jgi:Glycogen debranching enzyme